MDEKRIKEVFSDEVFVKGLLELEAPEEVQAALKTKDIDFTMDEIMRLHDELVKTGKKADENGELSLEQLDDVAGGLDPISGTALLIFALVAIFVGGAAGFAGGGLSKLRW